MTETAFVRVNAAQWAALQALTAGANTTAEGAEVAAIFAKPFDPSPQVIGDATDLIRPWRVMVGKVGREGAVTVTITGPQASGKTLMADAIAQSLATIKVPTHRVQLDGPHTRRITAAPNDYAVLIVDGQ